MANHKSALKRSRQSEKKKEHNKYYEKTTRNAIKKLRSSANKQEAESMYNKVASMLDKLAKKNIIHKNKASNLKSSLKKKINKLS